MKAWLDLDGDKVGVLAQLMKNLCVYPDAHVANFAITPRDTAF